MGLRAKAAVSRTKHRVPRYPRLAVAVTGIVAFGGSSCGHTSPHPADDAIPIVASPSTTAPYHAEGLPPNDSPDCVASGRTTLEFPIDKAEVPGMDPSQCHSDPAGGCPEAYESIVSQKDKAEVQVRARYCAGQHKAFGEGNDNGTAANHVLRVQARIDKNGCPREVTVSATDMVPAAFVACVRDLVETATFDKRQHLERVLDAQVRIPPPAKWEQRPTRMVK